MRLKELISSGPIAVDDLANRMASLIKAGVKDGVPDSSI